MKTLKYQKYNNFSIDKKEKCQYTNTVTEFMRKIKQIYKYLKSKEG